MKKLKIFSFLFLVFCFLFFVSSFLFLVKSPASAAILVLDPSTKSSPLGDNFEIKLDINTEGEQTTSADAVLIYDSNVLEVVNIQEGDGVNDPFYPDVFKNITNDEIYIGAAVRDPTEVREGQGTIALITFRGKTETATDVKFDCTPGKTSDSNISKNDKNATDIIECDRVVNGRYTIGTGIGAPATATPAPYASPTPIRFYPTATPTIPVAGSTETTVGVLAVGAVLTLLGIASKIILKL